MAWRFFLAARGAAVRPGIGIKIVSIALEFYVYVSVVVLGEARPAPPAEGQAGCAVAVRTMALFYQRFPLSASQLSGKTSKGINFWCFLLTPQYFISIDSNNRK